LIQTPESINQSINQSIAMDGSLLDDINFQDVLDGDDQFDLLGESFPFDETLTQQLDEDETDQLHPVRRIKLSNEEDSAVPNIETSGAESKEEDEGSVNLLAKELSKLGVSEREKVMFDIHGIIDMAQEEPDKIDKMLKELDQELLICTDETYLAALQQNKDLVTSKVFRLKFLRCECYNVQEAAGRIVNYFHLKKDLFGMELLTTDITLDNIGPEARQCVESGLGVSAILKFVVDISIF
jgi:hypothetical protein